MSLTPDREITTKLDSGAIVKLVAFEDSDLLGMETTNPHGDVTRALFSPGAVKAVVSGFNALLLGRGDKVQKEWRVLSIEEMNHLRITKKTTSDLSPNALEILVGFIHELNAPDQQAPCFARKTIYDSYYNAIYKSLTGTHNEKLQQMKELNVPDLVMDEG